MESVQTKWKTYRKYPGNRCIAQVVFVAEQEQFRVYVAWEEEEKASQGIFAFFMSKDLYPWVADAQLLETCDFGIDISDTGREEALFPSMF